MRSRWRQIKVPVKLSLSSLLSLSNLACTDSGDLAIVISHAELSHEEVIMTSRPSPDPTDDLHPGSEELLNRLLPNAAASACHHHGPIL